MLATIEQKLLNLKEPHPKAHKGEKNMIITNEFWGSFNLLTLKPFRAIQIRAHW
jgi:hypothetical protein